MVPTSLMSLNLQFVVFTKIHPKNSNFTTTMAWSQSEREWEQPKPTHGQTLLISSSSPSSASRTEVRCCQDCDPRQGGGFLIRNKDLSVTLAQKLVTIGSIWIWYFQCFYWFMQSDLLSMMERRENRKSVFIPTTHYVCTSLHYDSGGPSIHHQWVVILTSS